VKSAPSVRQLDRFGQQRNPKSQPILLHQTSPINDIVFNRSGSQLATASTDGTTEVWNWHEPTLPLVVMRQPGAVNALDAGRDGRHLATASNDGTVRVWDCLECGSFTQTL